MTEKRGRKKKANVTRHPNGEIYHEDAQKDTHKKICERRQEMYGLKNCSFDDNRAGYPLGRLNIGGFINGGQLNASNRFAAMANYHKSIMGFPNQSAKTLDMNSVRGISVNQELDSETIDKIKAEYNNVLSYVKHDGGLAGREAHTLNIIRDADDFSHECDAIIYTCKVLEKYYN